MDGYYFAAGWVSRCKCFTTLPTGPALDRSPAHNSLMEPVFSRFLCGAHRDWSHLCRCDALFTSARSLYFLSLLSVGFEAERCLVP